MKTPNPFKFTTKELDHYLESGQDIHIENKEGQTLWQYILSQKNSESSDLMKKMLGNPHYEIEKEKLQEFLYESFLWLNWRGFRSNLEKKTLINRFDLTREIEVSRMGAGGPKDYKTGWLSYFLCGTTHHLFLEAYKNHPDFKEGLKIIDTDKLNCWHVTGNYLVNNQTDKKTQREAYYILEILNQDNPEGLEQKNKYGERPLDTVIKRAWQLEAPLSNDDKKFQEQIEYTQKFIAKATLESQMLPKEIKIKNKI